MARILAIGIATVDIVNTVDAYPAEDAEVRALAQRVGRGGNATNTLVVLSQLGHACAWGGVLVEGPDAGPVCADLARYGIDTGPCRRLSAGKMPTSYVTLSRHSGSRTIVHYRDLPEFDYADFADIDLDRYDWLHFEGRNVTDTAAMLARARERRPGLPLSVEIEKPRGGIETLFGAADLLLFSRAYAHAAGPAGPREFLRARRREAPAADLVLSWGDAGAYGLDREGRESHSPAFPPPRLADTLGAGDTFNAGVIHGRLQGWDLARSITAACRLAGRKCGQAGLDGLDAIPAG